MKRFRIAVVMLVTLGAAVSSQAADRFAYVVNSVGETLSKINLTTGAVTNDILTLGSDVNSFPNQIRVNDSLAYVVCSGTSEIQVINLNTETTVNYISTGSGVNPFWIDLIDDNTAYVTNMLGNEVVRINLTNGAITKHIPVGISPEGLWIHGNRAYVAVTALDFNTFMYGQGKVVMIDLIGDSVLTEINVGKNPQYLERDAAGRLHVVCTGDYATVFGKVYRISTSLNTIIDSIDVGGTPGQIAISKTGVAYIAAGGWVDDGHVYSYNHNTGTVYHNSANPLLVDSGCVMVVADGDGTVYTGSFTDMVNQIDSGATVLDSYAVGVGPSHLAFSRPFTCCDLAGDANNSGGVSIGDVTFIIARIFVGGPPPPCQDEGDANGDGMVNIGDATYLLARIFSGGPAPVCGTSGV